VIDRNVRVIGKSFLVINSVIFIALEVEFPTVVPLFIGSVEFEMLLVANPLSWFAAAKPCPRLTKSSKRNCGLRFAPLRGTHLLTLATIEATEFVVGASSGSLMITPAPIGMMFMFRE